MFKKILFFLLINFTFTLTSFANIEIKARTAILQDFYSGEILYEKLLNASKVLIDCENEQVITLIDKITDEDMQIKKVLKSLGYTK